MPLCSSGFFSQTGKMDEQGAASYYWFERYFEYQEFPEIRLNSWCFCSGKAEYFFTIYDFVNTHNHISDTECYREALPRGICGDVVCIRDPSGPCPIA